MGMNLPIIKRQFSEIKRSPAKPENIISLSSSAFLRMVTDENFE